MKVGHILRNLLKDRFSQGSGTRKEREKCRYKETTAPKLKWNSQMIRLKYHVSADMLYQEYVSMMGCQIALIITLAYYFPWKK